ncbi:hypothetical protein [Pedobacter sp. UYEF25]
MPLNVVGNTGIDDVGGGDVGGVTTGGVDVGFSGDLLQENIAIEAIIQIEKILLKFNIETSLINLIYWLLFSYRLEKITTKIN